MAGRPARRKLFKSLELAAKASDVTPAEFVYDFIANGGTMTQLAERLDVERSYASRQLNADPELRKALDSARRQGAEAVAEDTLLMTDEIAARIDRGEDVSSERIATLREQVRVRQWLAAVNNPDRFSQKQNSVTINIGDMHLDALRKTRLDAVIDVTPTEATDE